MEVAERFALGLPADLAEAQLAVRRGSGTRSIQVTELLLDATFPPAEATDRHTIFRRATDAQSRVLILLREREFGPQPLGGYKPDDPLAPADAAAVVRINSILAALLRCVAHNPFRPGSIDPTWRTPTVFALARGIQDDQAFDGMPILADALEDAGCDRPDVLDHCRGAGPHARGCWVLESVLGRLADPGAAAEPTS